MTITVTMSFDVTNVCQHDLVTTLTLILSSKNRMVENKNRNENENKLSLLLLTLTIYTSLYVQ